MRSWQINELGNPWELLELNEVDAPEPGPGQVAIDIESVGVAFPNVLQAQGKYQVKIEPPFSPATEIAGTVAALGDGVTGFGDFLILSGNFGLTNATFAEGDLTGDGVVGFDDP